MLRYNQSSGNVVVLDLEISIHGPLICTINHHKVSKGAKIRNRYNQVTHLTQDTNGKVTNS